MTVTKISRVLYGDLEGAVLLLMPSESIPLANLALSTYRLI
jgi:hypothetical protein